MEKKTTPLILFAAYLMVMCTPVDQHELQDGRWIDLTHSFSAETLFWPTSSDFQLDTVFVGETEGGYHYEAYEFSTAEHGGTHLDAPVHFAEGQMTVDQLEVEQLAGWAVVIDVSELVEQNRDYQIQVDDITAWESVHGEIPAQAILLFYTGMAKYWPDAESYLGTSNRGEQALPELSFPGIHPETAEWIVDNRQIKALGLDTPSLDYGKSELFETHQILFNENIPGFENVANLDQLMPTGAYVIALPMKIRNGSGAPLRIVAHVNE